MTRADHGPDAEDAGQGGAAGLDGIAVQQALPGWQWQAADPPGSLRPWRPGEQLPVGVHDIWCRPGPGEPWRIQVMLDESLGDNWVSRRDERLRRPITSIGLVTSRGIPYLAPEIQLFYKAKNGRPKDETDFAALLPVLAKPQRQWLSDALRLVYGPAHLPTISVQALKRRGSSRPRVCLGVHRSHLRGRLAGPH